MGTTVYEGCTPCCGEMIDVPCCGTSLPPVLTVTVTDKSGDMTAFPDTFNVTWDGSLWSISDVISCGETPKGFTIQCDTGGTAEDFLATALDNTAVDPGGSCDPLMLVWTAGEMTPDCTGSATFTVTV